MSLYTISNIIEHINKLLWGNFTILIIFGTGLFLTVRTGFFQFRHMKHIVKSTLFSTNSKVLKSSGAITQLQALSTALAASMGTGNIVGVAVAISIGGSGAVFWMVVSSLFGMASAFTENVLGVKYKALTKFKSNPRLCGAMLYIEKGLGSKAAAVVYALSCIAASFGIGNMAQANAISSALSYWKADSVICGVILAAICAVIIMRGGRFIARATEKIIPAVSLFYIAGALIVIVLNASNIYKVFLDIFSSAFGFSQAVGGISGTIIKKSLTTGFRRGVFSNEAGMGSSVLAHSSSDCSDPVKMGMWAVVEVLIDTVICCTLTALAILCTGAESSGSEGIGMVIVAFTKGMGGLAGHFVCISIIIFAFATMLGWCYYGEQCVRYLSEKKSALNIYRILFIAAAFGGCVLTTSVIWEAADIFNIFMLLPNLAAVILLNAEAVTTLEEYKKQHGLKSTKHQ